MRPRNLESDALAVCKSIQSRRRSVHDTLGRTPRQFEATRHYRRYDTFLRIPRSPRLGSQSTAGSARSNFRCFAPSEKSRAPSRPDACLRSPPEKFPVAQPNEYAERTTVALRVLMHFQARIRNVTLRRWARKAGLAFFLRNFRLSQGAETASFFFAARGRQKPKNDAAATASAVSLKHFTAFDTWQDWRARSAGRLVAQLRR